MIFQMRKLFRSNIFTHDLLLLTLENFALTKTIEVEDTQKETIKDCSAQEQDKVNAKLSQESENIVQTEMQEEKSNKARKENKEEGV